MKQRQRRRDIKQLTDTEKGMKESRRRGHQCCSSAETKEDREWESERKYEQERESNISQVFEVDHCRPNI